MDLIKCPECGSEIKRGDKKCSNCGFPLSKTNELKKEKLYSRLSTIIALVVVALVIWSCISNGNDTQTTENNHAGIKENSVANISNGNNKKKKNNKNKSGNKKKKVSNSKLSKSKYKKKCKNLYYNDVFFGKKDLSGKLVKIDVFVKKTVIIDPYSLSDYEFIKKWKVKRTYFSCSVKRKKQKSYAGAGSINLYFSNKKGYKINTSKIGEGSKFTVYGEVCSWSNVTWDGYNKVSVMVRFVEGV